VSRRDEYSAALREYVARHDPDEIVDAIDAVVATTGQGSDPFVAAANRQILEAADW